MTSFVERFLPPLPYERMTPERLVNIAGQPIVTLPELFDADLTLHLNSYRPLWAIGCMRTLVVHKKGIDSSDPLLNTFPVSFTVCVWSGGLEAKGGTRLHFRIVTSIGQAKVESKGQCALEKCILALCKMWVVRPLKDRNCIKRPLDAIDHLDQAKDDIMKTCSTQEGGLTRRDVTAKLSEVQEAVSTMKRVRT